VILHPYPLLFFSKGGFSYKKINEQPTIFISNSSAKIFKSCNCRTCSKILEFNDFVTKEMKVVGKSPLKCLIRTLLSFKAFEKRAQTNSPIEVF
jgi:hypothetical protein